MSDDTYRERRAQMFPVLSDEHIRIVDRYGETSERAAGEILFEVGDERTDFYVVCSGCIEIVRPGVGGDETVTTHRAGEFTGEVDMLSQRRSLVRGVVGSGGTFVRLDRASFERLLAENADVSEIMMRAFILRRVSLIENDGGGLVLVGAGSSARTLVLEQFMTRAGQPYQFLDTEKDEAAGEMLETFGVGADETPVAIFAHSGEVVRNPSARAIADRVGLSGEVGGEVFDVAIVGAGPAGLSASVYAASEGLRAIALEGDAFGGQAGSSSKIENYLGFPTGISGGALAGRALNQAQKFGARLLVPRQVTALHCDRAPYELELDDGDRVRARSIVIASGARYRRLPIEEIEAYEGAGIYYGATFVEARTCADEEVVVVGGGNSAGQAAVFLSRHARRVHVMVRSRTLAASMSSYLATRLENSSSIELHWETEITGTRGDPHLEAIEVTGPEGSTWRPIRHVFVMIGAAPNTDWIGGCLATDARGFLCTGADLRDEDRAAYSQTERGPYHLESSRPGIFAVGDVRANSVKRVASAVGEGAMSIQFVHRAVAEGRAEQAAHG